MNIDTYVEKARAIAMYHDKDPMANFTYPSLGLAGESGELVDKLTLTSAHAPNKDDVLKEMGDVLWYIVNTCADIEIPFGTIVLMLTSGLSVTKFSELNSCLTHGRDHRYVLYKMPIYAGRIAEVAKKMIRDSNGEIPVEKFIVVEDSLAEMLRCLFEIGIEWWVAMDDVAEANIDKLYSRKDRGVLQGSGDNR